MNNPSEPAARKGFSLVRAIPLGILVAGLVLFFAFGLNRYISFEALQDHRDWLTDQVKKYGVLTPFAFMVLYAAMVAFSIPGGVILTIAAGFLFGIWLSTLYVWIAATVGATILFVAARTALGDFLRAKAKGALRRMEDGFRENALSYLLVLRLVPIFPFWLVNLVPAFLGVPLRVYVLATAIGIIPGTFVYASVGHGLGSLLESGQTPDLSIIYTPEVLTPICGLALLALIPVAYRKFKARRADGS